MELELIVLSIELHIPDLPVVGSRGKGGGCLLVSLSMYLPPFCLKHVYIFFYLPPSESIVSKDAGIEPRNVAATVALAVRHSARSHPHFRYKFISSE